MKLISASTKLVGLIGMPLGQSIAARLQNETYHDLNLDYFYFPIELPNPDDLPTLLAGLRLMNFGGMAVTKPFKVEILNYLDGCEETAKMIGSCNTIKIEDGKWVGHNTDGIGALRSLREEMRRDNMNGLKFVSFGAGGAARSVCFEVAKAGAAKIVLTDINDTCHQLADEINRYFPGVAEGLLANDPACEAKVSEADVLMNMSGLGMQPYLDKTPIPQGWIEPRHICFDAIYTPHKTRFLLEAEQKGCHIINGLDMCKYQGAAQIEIWTGLAGAETFMHKSLLGILEERKNAGTKEG